MASRIGAVRPAWRSHEAPCRAPRGLGIARRRPPRSGIARPNNRSGYPHSLQRVKQVLQPALVDPPGHEAQDLGVHSRPRKLFAPPSQVVITRLPGCSWVDLHGIFMLRPRAVYPAGLRSTLPPDMGHGQSFASTSTRTPMPPARVIAEGRRRPTPALRSFWPFLSSRTLASRRHRAVPSPTRHAWGSSSFPG